MCRINGIIHKNISQAFLGQMRDTLAHGGPDDAGLYINQQQSVGLAQRRLSIIDLSEGGHQPMHYKDCTIVFNGEIYNYQAIAEQLKALGYAFSSGSDTEVVLKAFDCWGYDAVQHFRGMFAFALWNETTQKLLLCRDRVGVKPLYWYLKDDLFMFASELKAFHQHPDFDKSINHQAVSLYLQTGYIRSPHCIFEYAHKIEPGSFLEIDKNLNQKTWKYWSIREQYALAEPSQKSDNELITDCENLLTESFKLRMVADVPVGMFLSGGVDSSLVTALLQKDSPIPLKTFTIGFDDPKFNEATFAKEVAKHIKTDHTELYCNESHFEEIIESIPDFYDEPFGDSSAIPTYLVSKLARQSVTVSLSADGGDEIFTGYNRYLFAESLYNKFSKIPQPFKKLAGKVAANISTNFVQNVMSVLPLPHYYKQNTDARLPKLVETLKAKSHIDFLYASTLFMSKEGLAKVHQVESKVPIFDKDFPIKKGQRFGAYGVADIESYLEGDIMTKVDRATMRVALEGREPFLDHKIIEFAMSLPDHLKIRNGQTKWILRQILYKYVPKELIERPKMGFGIPLDQWLSTILKQDLLNLAEDQHFFEAFRFNPLEVKRIIHTYLNNKGNSPYLVWYFYCLHKWFKRWL